MANAPVQVILNADSLRRDREKPTGGSSGKDFFEGANDAFEAHQKRLCAQVQGIAAKLGQSGQGDLGYVKVTLHPSAWAKTHRPREAIFREHITPPSGAGRLGELINEVTSQSLLKVEQAIAKAEVFVSNREDRETRELLPAPTKYRCEVSAIDKIELWGKTDRRGFDLADAINWLSDERTGHAYLVELFARPPGPGQLDTLSEGKRQHFQTLEEGLRSLGPGLIARLPDRLPPDTILMEVRLNRNETPPAVFVQSKASRRETSQQFDSRRERHAALIGFLENHPLVRQIHLPNVLVHSATGFRLPSGSPKKWKAPKPSSSGKYPRVGIIDGGVSRELEDWVAYRHDFLASEHTDLYHGSFIGGLLVGGKAINPSLPIDVDGCMVADINLYPADSSGAFDQYFPDGLTGFFDELASAVETCKRQYGVRVFNMSLNILSPVLVDKYSIEARRLDQIAEDNDAIFVISAGNLDPSNLRAEWPKDDAKATAILAAHRNDQICIPAESVRNLSVAAINPDGMSNCVGGAPARYSRRGPGLRSGVKPDLCHIGGAGTVCPTKAYGLHSHSPTGDIVSGCGTSYAAPLVAKTLGWLASAIEGETSRETLMALAIHHAQLPGVLGRKAFAGIAQQMVGFGQPPNAHDAMNGEDHQITLLFSSRIFEGKTLEFKFVWPRSLITEYGGCRGDVRLTLVATPHLDYQYGDELVRANIEAALQQENAKGQFRSELEPTYVFFSDSEKVTEAELIEHKFKWSPVKVFGTRMPRGRGSSSNWRLVVNYLARAGERLPKQGIPFSVLLTIADPKREAPVFQEVRQMLQAKGIQTADIRTAARVTPRV